MPSYNPSAIFGENSAVYFTPSQIMWPQPIHTQGFYSNLWPGFGDSFSPFANYSVPFVWNDTVNHNILGYPLFYDNKPFAPYSQTSGLYSLPVLSAVTPKITQSMTNSSEVKKIEQEQKDFDELRRELGIRQFANPNKLINNIIANSIAYYQDDSDHVELDSLFKDRSLGDYFVSERSDLAGDSKNTQLLSLTANFYIDYALELCNRAIETGVDIGVNVHDNFRVVGTTVILKNTPLILACKKGWHQHNVALTQSNAIMGILIQFLVKAGADVNAQDGLGNTALHIAVMKREIVTIKYLMEHGAKVDIQNDSGYTPLDMLSVSYDRINDFLYFETGGDVYHYIHRLSNKDEWNSAKDEVLAILGTKINAQIKQTDYLSWKDNEQRRRIHANYNDAFHKGASVLLQMFNQKSLKQRVFDYLKSQNDRPNIEKIFGREIKAVSVISNAYQAYRARNRSCQSTSAQDVDHLNMSKPLPLTIM